MFSHCVKCHSRPNQNYQRNWTSEQHNTVHTVDHSISIHIHVYPILREKNLDSYVRENPSNSLLPCIWLRVKDKCHHWCHIVSIRAWAGLDHPHMARPQYDFCSLYYLFNTRDISSANSGCSDIRFVFPSFQWEVLYKICANLYMIY